MKPTKILLMESPKRKSKKFDYLISLHLPKTAGRSFRFYLKSIFEQNFILDKSDGVLHNSLEQRQVQLEEFLQNHELDAHPAPCCFHGHFLMYKYYQVLQEANVLYVCWMRDPFQRMRSHYDYWLRNYNPTRAESLHKKVVEEAWSFEQFCFSKQMQNVYCQFLWKFPVDKFDFIGITEYFNEDLKYFHDKYFNKHELKFYHEHKNPFKEPIGYKPSEDQFFKDFQEFHKEDYLLYQAAFNDRSNRY